MFSEMEQAALTAQDNKHISRDEMNLAEFPLTVLSTRANPGIKTLEFSDTVKGKNGEIVNRKWIITAADKFGLPTSSDDEILLGLVKLTVDSGFADRKVYFTRYELLKILRWSTEGRNYSRLQKALDRLSGVRIKASNAFFDNESKSHSTRNFGIIDAYEINDGRDLDLKHSFFIWSEVLFKSFQAKYIKKLDLNFFLALQSAVSRRLYRFLDKHFWYKAKVQINLFTLAHEKIGISRNYKYASSLRQQLEPAAEELIEKGFITSCEFKGKGKDTEVVIYSAGLGKSSKGRGESSSENQSSAIDVLSDDRSNYESLEEELVAKLVKRGISSRQAKQLVHDKGAANHDRINKIINHFDFLYSSKRHKMRSPVGFLYRAVQNSEDFVLPQETEKEKTKAKQIEERREDRDQKVNDRQQDLEARYLIERKTEVTRMKQEMEPALLKRMEGEVREALRNLKSIISSERFEKAVEHGVAEKIAKLFQFPDFREWKDGHAK